MVLTNHVYVYLVSNNMYCVFEVLELVGYIIWDIISFTWDGQIENIWRFSKIEKLFRYHTFTHKQKSPKTRFVLFWNIGRFFLERSLWKYCISSLWCLAESWKWFTNCCTAHSGVRLSPDKHSHSLRKTWFFCYFVLQFRWCKFS